MSSPARLRADEERGPENSATFCSSGISIVTVFLHLLGGFCMLGNNGENHKEDTKKEDVYLLKASILSMSSTPTLSVTNGM